MQELTAPLTLSTETVFQTVKRYCTNLNAYQRVIAHEVRIGDEVVMGGGRPVVVQSMTTVDTLDTAGTVAQAIRMIEAGCELVRVTAPSQKEAENLANIKQELRARGYRTPLVADIHFTPNAAEIAARIVEKVRINPGNYADKKKFELKNYTDEAYAAELERIYKRFAPLVKLCKEYGTALRIGTNHGSLSDRIMSRYGDTPLGMVESAMEFVRICEDLGFDQIVLSMKASNPQVMVQAYRLLAATMLAHGRFYPLHLGVTEAGDGEDGRIKSALGIGTLLQDGLGDTVRVSLTEEPEAEMPVAQAIIQATTRLTVPVGKPLRPEALPYSPYTYARLETRAVGVLGQGQTPPVFADLSHEEPTELDLAAIGYSYWPEVDKWTFSDQAADFAYFGHQTVPFTLPGGLRQVYDAGTWFGLPPSPNVYPFFRELADWEPARLSGYIHPETNFVGVRLSDGGAMLKALNQPQTVGVVLGTPYEARAVVQFLRSGGCQAPLVRLTTTDVPEALPVPLETGLQVESVFQCGQGLVDGLWDGLWLQPAQFLLARLGQTASARLLNRMSFGILQAARLRMTKTEYISCPSCGRTLFDLMETTARIRSRTEHLKGVKIGIMGCIVNGPGEMADADYGYVGAGPGVISLYKGQEMKVKAVPTAEAVDRLIELIAEDGRWVPPPNESMQS